MSYTSAQYLSAAGSIPGLAAGLIGRSIQTVAGTGTTQASGALIQQGSGTTVVGTTAASQTAFTLPANTPAGDAVEFFCTTATTALVFPEVGSAIAGLGANNSLSVAQNKGVLLVRASATQWWHVLGAAS